MPKLIHSTQPPLKFIPQRFNPFILKLLHWLLPFVLRFRTRPWLPAGIVQVEAKNAEVLAKLYQQFQAGKIRFLIAFRHPQVDDPLSMMYLLSRIVPRVARQQAIPLQYPTHSHFIYDRGMTIWAGNWLGWLFSLAGGITIRRGKRIDRQALQTARELFAHGKMPIAVAPEGGTNGHSGIVSPLEPGVAQLGFWCVEDLQKANRSETVFILPVSIQYSYVQPSWAKIDWLLTKLEADSGLSVTKASNSTQQPPEEIYYPRLLALAEHLISEMEEFYRRFYHQDLPEVVPTEATETNQVLIARLHRLMDKALQVSEQYFGLEAQGNFIDRCRRLEEASWSYIYREDLPNLDTLAPLKRGLADWVAQEADLRIQHMRIVEKFVGVTANYIQEKPTVDRFAETLLLIFDMISRIKDTNPPGRPSLGGKTAQITIGEPISVSHCWLKSQTNRQAARQGVTDLTQDLQVALSEMIS